MPMTPLAPRLSPAVEQRLLDARDAAHECISALIRERGDDTDYSEEARRRMFHAIRRIASIDAARHGRDFHALTFNERAWLQAQGVAMD